MGQTDTSTNGDLTALPATVYVGIASTAHHNDVVNAWPLLFLNTAEFDNYSSAYVPTQPTLAIGLGGPGGTNFVVSFTPTGGRLEWSPVVGPGAVWQPVTPDPYATPFIIPATNASQFFRVVDP